MDVKKSLPFYITQHMRERFVQRSYKKYARLKHLPEEEATWLFDEMHEEIKQRRLEIDDEITTKLLDAKEDRSCINNSQFMSRYYDKFGYDHRFQFLADKDFVYIIVLQEGKRKVVTCVKASTHLAGKNSARPKFGRS